MADRSSIMHPQNIATASNPQPIAKMKLYIFLVCHPDGTATHFDVRAESSILAVRDAVAAHAGCRFNIVNICNL